MLIKSNYIYIFINKFLFLTNFIIGLKIIYFNFETIKNILEISLIRDKWRNPRERKREKLGGWECRVAASSELRGSLSMLTLTDPLSLVKEFKTTQSKNSFDSSLSLIQKCSKD